LRKSEIVLVDVRPREEFAAGHIPGAASIPLDELEQRLAELPADREVIAYCRGPFCAYAHEAVRQLREPDAPPGASKTAGPNGTSAMGRQDESAPRDPISTQREHTMSTAQRQLNTSELEQRVKDMYEEVALEPEREFHFETGRPLAERLGYPAADLDRIPAAAIASFAGVGYFLDLAAIAPGRPYSISAAARAPTASPRH
jgi:rhodanese-related sulfurtransferase